MQASSNRRGPGSALFSIGHSNHPIERFLRLLQQHDIRVVADVRSQPHSAHAPQFNRRAIENTLHDHNVTYLYLGEELGGRPRAPEFYDDHGRVLYDKLAATPTFLDGLQRLEMAAEGTRLAIMCSEEDPINCHRYRLVASNLSTGPTSLLHVRGDGRLETSAQIEERRGGNRPGQPRLFESA